MIEPLIGYLKLAEMQFKNKINNNPHWNFGPDIKNFVSVNEIVKLIKKKTIN